MNRTVAIVGRPNVGKSSIFNRVVGRRVAIVHEESGVTRDRLIREVEREGDLIQLIDTGGVGNMDSAHSPGEIEAGTRRQVDVALEDAAVVIFVLNVEDGIVSLDEEVMRLLRASGRDVILAANKCDTVERDSLADEYQRFGFDVFPVSALHSRGIGPLMDAVVDRLPAVEKSGAPEALKVAVVGRPNVGKSSYVNRLLHSDRVIVSEVPGTTRDSIDVPFRVGDGVGARHYVLTDTAGLRRRGKVDSAVETYSAMRAVKSIERSDVVVLMIDGERGPTAQDRKIAAKVEYLKRGCVLVVNKWDLCDHTTQRQYVETLTRELPFFAYVPTVYISAKTGYNVRKSIDAIDHVAAEVSREIPTGILNRVVLDAYEKVHPPLVKNKPLKIYYCTQLGQRPIRIGLFVNEPKRVQPAYRTYLTRKIRSAFGLEGAPVVLHFRARRESRPRAR